MVAIIHQIRRGVPATNAKTVADMKDFAADQNMEVSRLLGKVDRDAAAIADTMGKIHGGCWQSKIDHERRAVLIWYSE